jgi:hypothetical protein
LYFLVSVEDDADDLVRTELGERVVDRVARRLARAHDELEAVDEVLHEDGVGDGQDGHGVEQHEVEQPAGRLQDGVHARRAQQLRPLEADLARATR